MYLFPFDLISKNNRPYENPSHVRLSDRSWCHSSLRGVGSAALGMSSVAAGWGDIFYHFGLCCWDMAAGTLILTEAGGYVCDTEGWCPYGVGPCKQVILVLQHNP